MKTANSCAALLAASMLLISSMAQAQTPPHVQAQRSTVQRDPGTWGPFKVLGGQPFEFKKWERGELDPPPVADELRGIRSAEAHIARAKALLRIGRGPQMREALDAAIRIDPANVEARHLRARLSLFNQKFDSAIGDLTEAIRAGGADTPADIFASRAHAFKMINEMEQAVTDARAALKAKPDHEIGPSVMLEYLVRQEMYGEADAILNSVLTRNGNNANIVQNAIEVYHALGRFSEVERLYTRLIGLAPSFPFHWRGRAQARIALKDSRGALDDYDAILGKDGQHGVMPPFGPHAAVLLLERASLHYQLSTAEKAATDIAAALKTGGQQQFLKWQLFLRHSGSQDVALDGIASPVMQQRLGECLANARCRDEFFSADPMRQHRML